MSKEVKFEGKSYIVPDDFTIEDIIGYVEQNTQQPIDKTKAPEEVSTYQGKGDWNVAGITPEIRKVAEPIANEVALGGASMFIPGLNITKGAKAAQYIAPIIKSALTGATYGGLTSKGENTKEILKDIGIGGTFGAIAPGIGKGMEKIGEKVISPAISTSWGWGGGLRKEVTDYAKKHFPEMYAVKKDISLLPDEVKKIYDKVNTALNLAKNKIGRKVKATLPPETILDDAVSVIDKEIDKFSTFKQTDEIPIIVNQLNKLRGELIPSISKDAIKTIKSIDEGISVLNKSAQNIPDTDPRKIDLLNQIDLLNIEKAKLSPTSTGGFSKDEILLKKKRFSDYAKSGKSVELGSKLPDGSAVDRKTAEIAGDVYDTINKSIDKQSPANKVARKGYEDILETIEPISERLKESEKLYTMGAKIDDQTPIDDFLRGVVAKIEKVVPKAKLKEALLAPETYNRVFSQSLPDLRTVNPYSLVTRLPGMLGTGALGAGVGGILGGKKGAYTGGALGFGAGFPMFSQQGVRNAIRLSNLSPKIGNMSKLLIPVSNRTAYSSGEE
jgi:hypothetical protein